MWPKVHKILFFFENLIIYLLKLGCGSKKLHEVVVFIKRFVENSILPSPIHWDLQKLQKDPIKVKFRHRIKQIEKFEHFLEAVA